MNVDELLAAVSETEDDEPVARVEMRAATWTAHALDVEIEVRAKPRELRGRWLLRCRNPAAHALTLGPVEDIEIQREHPLLWAHTEPMADLSFYGEPASLQALVGELWQAHEAIGDPRVPFAGNTSVLDGGYGVFACGPERLLRAYEAVLARHHMKPSLIVLHGPRRWDGVRWCPADKELSLLLLDRSYVVATSVEAIRVAGSEPRVSVRAMAYAMLQGLRVGLFDRSDVFSWAIDVIEREATPPLEVIEVATNSHVDESALSDLLGAIPGALEFEEVERMTVGALARAVSAGKLDLGSAARMLSSLCEYARGELGTLAVVARKFRHAEADRKALAEISETLRGMLRPYEVEAAALPLPRRGE